MGVILSIYHLFDAAAPHTKYITLGSAIVSIYSVDNVLQKLSFLAYQNCCRRLQRTRNNECDFMFTSIYTEPTAIHNRVHS